MSGGVQLMLMIAGVHLLGLACAAVLMIPAFKEGPMPPPRPDSGPDDGGGPGPGSPPEEPTPPGGGIPLPDAVPATVRLREPGRLSELLPRRERRPAHEPNRRPVRV